MMRKFGAALAVSVLLVASGCGGGDRPSESELSKALQKGAEGSSILGDSGTEVSKKSADCIAKILAESDISDRALKAIVEGRKNYTASKADTAAAIKVSGKIVKCLPAGLK